jgi:hypothetical protein
MLFQHPAYVHSHGKIAVLRATRPYGVISHTTPFIVGPRHCGCAVEVSVRVESDLSEWLAPIATGKVMQRRVGPAAVRGSQLENIPLSVTPTNTVVPYKISGAPISSRFYMAEGVRDFPRQIMTVSSHFAE